ncbi:hypothetical protein Acsp05_55350 [Actinokineospora sp. NBRC 105648]|nr:hypothetical protein Acsp05_55350 [Actinokineospora sp. NBRC 105648]
MLPGWTRAAGDLITGRTLLARLALDAGRVVPTAAMIDGLWGEDPPADTTNALRSLVSLLRPKADGLVGSRPTGHRLLASQGDADAHRLEQLTGACGGSPRAWSDLGRETTAPLSHVAALATAIRSLTSGDVEFIGRSGTGRLGRWPASVGGWSSPGPVGGRRAGRRLRNRMG